MNSEPVEQDKLSKVKKYTDDQLLHICFDFIINHTLNTLGNDRLDPSYWFADGFEAPLDPDNLAPFMYDLAKRLGYKLEKGMWIEL
jgi:hypothetical protein